MKHMKHIVVIRTDGSSLHGEPYLVDQFSPKPFPDYSTSTQQDYSELDKVLSKLGPREDYISWDSVLEIVDDTEEI